MKNNTKSEERGAWAFLFIFTTIFSLMLGIADARAEGKPQEKKGVLVAGFLDNWNVSIAGGVNTILDNGQVGAISPALDITIGKWITPHVGIRVGWQGISNKLDDTAAGWVFGNEKFSYNYTHADIMFSILGFEPQRVFSPCVYFHAGAIHTASAKKVIQSEAGLGLGILMGFRIVGNLQATLDARVTVSREEAWRESGKAILFPSATAGLVYNFGKNVGFKKPETVKEVVKVEVLKDCDHEQQLAALKAQIDSLKKVKASDVQVLPKPTIAGWVTYFQLDKSTLLEREKFHLMDLVKILPDGATLTIVGHADKETGSRRRNAVLAEERVNAVGKALTDLGFQGKIVKDAKGDTANPFPNPFPKNRCVTIEVVLP